MTTLVTRWVFYKRKELLIPREHKWVHPGFFVRVRVAHLFSILCCVCVRAVSCVPHVTSASGLSIVCVRAVSCVPHVTSGKPLDCPLFVFVLCLVCPMVPLDCPLLIALSVIFKVY